MELSLACTLTDTDLGERRRTILDSVRRAVLDVSPLLKGYAYRFEATSEILSQLARLVDLERQCCAFLTFRIIVEAGQQPICLEITGPPEAKAVIAVLFGSRTSAAPRAVVLTAICLTASKRVTAFISQCGHRADGEQAL